MQTKTVYSYMPITKEYLGPLTLNESDMSPLEPGVFLIPGNTQLVPPPTIPHGFFARALNKAWELVPVPVAEQIPEEVVEPLPVVVPADPQKLLTAGIQEFMDTMAQSVGYDDLKTAITYRGDPNPLFAAQAEAFFVFRSVAWTKCYAHLAEILVSGKAFPTLAEALALLPPLTIPKAV